VPDGSGAAGEARAASDRGTRDSALPGVDPGPGDGKRAASLRLGPAASRRLVSWLPDRPGRGAELPSESARGLTSRQAMAARSTSRPRPGDATLKLTRRSRTALVLIRRSRGAFGLLVALVRVRTVTRSVDGFRVSIEASPGCVPQAASDPRRLLSLARTPAPPTQVTSRGGFVGLRAISGLKNQGCILEVAFGICSVTRRREVPSNGPLRPRSQRHLPHP